MARNQFSELDAEPEELSNEEWSARNIGLALIHDGIWNDVLGKLARHEASLMNAFTKTLQMLLLLQSTRASEKGDGTAIEAVALPPKDR